MDQGECFKDDFLFSSGAAWRMEVPFLRRGTQGRRAAAAVIAPHSGDARYPPSSPQARAPQSPRRRANLPGSGGERPQYATLWSLFCRGRQGPLLCPPPPRPFTPALPPILPGDPRSPHLLTHSSPFGFEIWAPIPFECRWRSRELVFRWDLCARAQRR